MEIRGEKLCLEALIGKLDLKTAYEFFVVLMPLELRTCGLNHGLTEEQKTLLGYVLSFKGEPIADEFSKIIAPSKNMRIQ